MWPHIKSYKNVHMVYNFITRYLSLATKYFKSVPPFNLYFFFKLKVILFLYMMKLMSTKVSVISDINIILKSRYGNITCILWEHQCHPGPTHGVTWPWPQARGAPGLLAQHKPHLFPGPGSHQTL